VADDDRAIKLETPDEPGHVGGYLIEAIAARPVAQTVTALVHGDDAEALDQVGRGEVPDAGVGGETMEED
jgi:hypothetical protein